MEELNPMPICHDHRNLFIGDMADDMRDALEAVDLDWTPDRAQRLSTEFYEELWTLSWELEGYYRRYVAGYREAQGST